MKKEEHAIKSILCLNTGWLEIFLMFIIILVLFWFVVSQQRILVLTGKPEHEEISLNSKMKSSIYSTNIMQGVPIWLLNIYQWYVGFL